MIVIIKTLKYTLLSLTLSICWWGCARVTTSVPATANTQQAVTVVNDGYTGVKKRVQVVSFDLPDTLLKRYPELKEKRIGWGLANRLVDAFYETNRFQFVEEKEAMLDKVMKNWALSQSGAVSEATQIKTDGLTAPEYLVYAEVFDFSVSNTGSVKGLAAKSQATTNIGIQIRLVDIATGEYIPASGTGDAVVSTNGNIWAATNTDFNQSTVGIASQTAINSAVNTLIKRMR
jgi:curli biogenesis system outer membrane secretion channel CsgG